MAQSQAKKLLGELIRKNTDPVLNEELRTVLLELESPDTGSSKKGKAKRFVSAIGKFPTRVAEHEVIKEVLENIDDLAP